MLVSNQIPTRCPWRSLIINCGIGIDDNLNTFPVFRVPFGEGWIPNRLKFQGDKPTILSLYIFIGPSEPYLDCRDLLHPSFRVVLILL